MKFANLAGRAVLLVGGGAIDLARASDGALPSDPMCALARWDEVLAFAASTDVEPEPFDLALLGAPVPRPGQVFAIALNYHPHIGEAGYLAPSAPLVFTKFPSCISGPYTEVALPGGHVDWEVELVVVIGRPAHHVSAERAYDVVAGLTVGQDISERILQLRGTPAQFSLGKSYPGFGPIGPAIITPDEFVDPDNLAISCRLNGEEVQGARTGEMVFSVAELIVQLTAVCQMYAGDLIFTGTPGGVGNRREPAMFLAPGDELVSTIEEIGELRNRFISGQ